MWLKKFLKFNLVNKLYLILKIFDKENLQRFYDISYHDIFDIKT